MSPGRESDVVSALYTKTLVSDYEKLCGTDILDLEKTYYNHNEFVFEKSKKKKKKTWTKAKRAGMGQGSFGEKTTHRGK